MHKQAGDSMSRKALIQAFFHDPTNTATYLVIDPATGQAALIDPVLDYDHRSGEASTGSADVILAAAKTAGATIQWILETHAHADHLSAAPYLKLKTGAKVGIGEHIRDVQRIFRPVFNAIDVSGDGREFDHLFRDGETFRIGDQTVEVLHTPGHTPACVSYRVGDAAFVGDTLFMPDYGTARADFPGGSARTLYHSIRRLLSLPPETQIFVCHDYKAPGRDHFAWQTTVAEERAKNPHVRDGITENEFVAMREARDAKLPAPTLLMPSIQVNIRAGRLPPAEPNGVHYLKVPITLKGQQEMSDPTMDYNFRRTVEGTIDTVVPRVVNALKVEGFGVLTEIDIQATLKAKLGEDFRPYRILGACNPSLALQALKAEPRVGVMLPCNVIVHQTGTNEVEIASINPAAPMRAVGNPKLDPIAEEVGARLGRVIAAV
jgi:glyoxylase-like metal-dependent hydrolase (beta-lactamase superfamily II)/uncharacterized protein (DUF302 family)